MINNHEKSEIISKQTGLCCCFFIADRMLTYWKQKTAAIKIFEWFLFGKKTQEDFGNVDIGCIRLCQVVQQ